MAQEKSLTLAHLSLCPLTSFQAEGRWFESGTAHLQGSAVRDRGSVRRILHHAPADAARPRLTRSRGDTTAPTSSLTTRVLYGSRPQTVNGRFSLFLRAVLVAVVVAACSKSEQVRVVPQSGPIQPRRVAFHPKDPARLLVVELSGTVGVWDLSDLRTPVKILQLFASALDASFSADGKGIITIGHRGRVTWWDEEGRAIWASKDSESEPGRAVAVGGTDGLIATGSGDGTLKLWASSGAVRGRQKAHDGTVLSLAMAPHGDVVASAGLDQLVKLWKRGQGSSATQPLEEQVLVSDVKPVMTKLLPSLIKLDALWGWDHALAFSPDGGVIAAADYDGGVRLWNVDGTARTPQLKGHQGHYVRAVAFSPHGDLWASAGFDGNVKIWDLGGALRATMVAHNGAALSVSFSAHGETVATAGSDDRVTLWKPDGTALGVLPRGRVSQILSTALLPQRGLLVTGSATGAVRLWTLDALPKTAPMTGHEGGVASLAISGRGSLIASGGADGTVRLWNANGTLAVHAQPSMPGQVLSLAFSPRDDSFVSGSRALVRLWNMDGTARADLTGLREMVSTLGYSPSGDLIAAGDFDGGLMIWNADGKVRVEANYEKSVGTIHSLTFAPDGESLATAGDDGAVHLWKTDGSEIGEPLRGPTAPLQAVVFSPNGDRLIAGGTEGTLWSWKLPSRQASRVEIGLPINQLTLAEQGLWVRAAGGYMLLVDDDMRVAAWMLVEPDGALAVIKDGYYAGSGPIMHSLAFFRGTDRQLSQEEVSRLHWVERVAAETGL